MKKIGLFGILLVLVGVVVSCATLPKEVKEGDTLVIGGFEVQTTGYNDTGYGRIKSEVKGGIKIHVTDAKSGKEYLYTTNKDGYVYMKNLKAHESYYVSKVEMNVSGSKGTFSTWVDMPKNDIFIPYDRTVVNIGIKYFVFDGENHRVSWETKGHEIVEFDFSCLDVDSEWMSKDIVRQFEKH